jgi:hypothetical protein
MYLTCFLVLLFVSSAGVKVEKCDTKANTFPSPTFEQPAAYNFPWFYVKFILLYPTYPRIIYNMFMFSQFSVHIHCLHNWGFCCNSSEHYLVTEHVGKSLWNLKMYNVMVFEKCANVHLTHISRRQKHLKWNVNLWMRSQWQVPC